jgi:tripeptidyl-peptidase-1
MPTLGWTTLPSEVDESATVTFMLALRQQNVDKLESIALSVSDPKSADYQKFMTIEEITSLVAPPAEVQAKVIDALVAAGVAPSDIINLGDSLDVKASVKAASTFFDTKFFNFEHSETKMQTIKSMGYYSLPLEIAEHIEMTVGISSFPIPHLDAHQQFSEAVKGSSNLRGVKSTPANGDMSFIPQTIFNMYQVDAETSGSELNTSQGVIEFTGPSQSFSPSDLEAWAADVNITITAPAAADIIGSNVPSDAGVEAQLDIEAMGGVNDEATLWFWIESGSTWQYGFATHFFATQDVPTVSSISYAWSEQDQCQPGVGSTECSALGNIDSATYVGRVNTEYAKIAARGLSLLSASGDSGANGRTDSYCSGSQLLPDYPAASSWITSVGATQLNNPVADTTSPSLCATAGMTCAISGEEVAVSYAVANFASGGGFSWYTPRPAWQEAAVSEYLTSQAATLPPASYFNSTGRAFPDIAALGHNFLMLINGSPMNVGGTSVSAPIVGALFSMLNEVAVKKSGKPLGFLSPLLYQMYADDKTIFHDITVGDNKCTEGGCAASCQGYTAAPGFDPVTGLGSLNYAKAEAYITKMFEAKTKPQKVVAEVM